MFFQLMSDSVVELSSEPEASVELETGNLCVADITQWNILKRPANENYKFFLCESQNERKTQRRKCIKCQTIVTANNQNLKN